MDHIDRKIIDILQQNARAPLKEIADRVFLSSPAVSARIARLEREGVLSGYQARIDAPKAGYTVKAFINLDMDPQRKPEFYPYIQGCPPRGGVQLRYRGLQHADRGTVPHHPGTGPVHQPSAAVRPHPHPDRVFHPGGAPGACRWNRPGRPAPDPEQGAAFPRRCIPFIFPGPKNALSRRFSGGLFLCRPPGKNFCQKGGRTIDNRVQAVYTVHVIYEQ